MHVLAVRAIRQYQRDVLNGKDPSFPRWAAEMLSFAQYSLSGDVLDHQKQRVDHGGFLVKPQPVIGQDNEIDGILL